MRDELLNREEFANVKEAKVLAEDYRDHYNHHRPHGALGYLSPVEFAAIQALAGQDSGPVRAARICTKALIVSGTDNGVRSVRPVQREPQKRIQAGSWMERRTARIKGRRLLL